MTAAAHLLHAMATAMTTTTHLLHLSHPLLLLKERYAIDVRTDGLRQQGGGREDG